MQEFSPEWATLAAEFVAFAFRTDMAGQFTWVVPHKRVGGSADSLRGQAATSLLVAAEEDPFFPGRRLFQAPYQMWDAAGNAIPIVISCAPLRDAAGTVIGTTGLALFCDGSRAISARQHTLDQRWRWRVDAATGLFTEIAFVDEVARRIERLLQEGRSGTLLLARLTDGPPNPGPRTEAEMLLALGELLRAAVRPTDVCGRMDNGDFAVWLDGADQFTAAERAEDLRRQAPHILADSVDAISGDKPPRISQVITPYPLNSLETIEQMLLRARDGMEVLTRNNPGAWGMAPPFADASAVNLNAGQ